MYFSVLGPLTVTTAAVHAVAIPEAKVRALLAALLAHEGRTAPADRLIDDLWGERLPGNPAGALQTKVSRLRRALADAEPGAGELLGTRPPGYALRVGPDDVDAARFAAMTAAAHATADPRARADLLTGALALWRGDAYADLRDAEFLRIPAERLDEQRLTALETLAETRLDLGEHRTLTAELAELSERHPLRERLRAAQLLALYRAGRQSEALAVYDALRRRLADELGVDPGPQLTALHRAILIHDAARDTPRPRPAPAFRGPAAPLTALVGRADAVAAVRRLLSTHRLVTLTGPGGVGKSRLAEEAAAGAAGDRPDGVLTVGLAGTTAVAEHLGAALGVREEEHVTLEDALRHRRLLLLLDNCEHVIDPAAETVRRLLAAAPGLTVLATSQEPLGLGGEAVWTVPPLGQDDAERLFALRAADSAPGFAVTGENAAAVATICRRLDRIPLAIELAATRVRALGVHALAARLDDRFALLTGGRRDVPPRQRTLRAVLDWSWDLLADDERTLLRRLAVFADGCTLDAAEAVCGGAGEDVVGALVRLVDRSLVAVGDGPRYRLPESVAAYARERLAEAGESDAVGQAHHAHYAALVEEAAPALHGPGQRGWLARLDRESADLRAALAHAVGRGDAAGALRTVLASAWYWFLRGRVSEARRSLDEALRVAATADGSGDGGDDGDVAALAARAAVWHAGFALLAGAEGGVRAPAPSAADGDARATWFLGHAALRAGEDLARSETLVGRALAAARTAGDSWGVAAALGSAATQALLRGDLAAARRGAEEGHALFGELGDGWGLLQTAYPLAALAAITGDHARAERLHREGLRHAEELGFPTEAADRITGLGRVALLTGDLPRAAELHRAAMTLAAEHGYAAGEVHAEIGLGLVARRAGDLDGAERHLRRTLDWHRAVAFGPGPALLLAELGFLAEQRGDAPSALALHRQGLAEARRGGDPRAVALAKEGLAGAYAVAGRPVRAARLLGEGARIRASVGVPLPPGERGDVDRVTAALRAALGADGLAAASAPPARRP
ncbi:BTAD domain-containing putative transcriptional regulator [Streptomyces avicenniae]|uniref:BTAD domain-containing putative transcriptional regulator n=1 Tax=Streptomyces avicenniae TaxID=500153 RepID=UPI000699F356|nr:BTAD domain-containing putative transcriptional regulator [Streptomyces avicenniae]